MSAQAMVKRIAARFGEGHQKTATFPPFSKNGPPPPPNGSPSQRNIPKDHDFDPRALKPMAKTLWVTSVSLGHALTAYRHLNRLKSTTVSPDGMLGGRGYVMGMKEARQRLFDACEALSAIADTLYDEIQGPHWKSKLGQLDENDVEDVERFVQESQEILDNPEDEAEKEIHAIEEENDDTKASKLPGGGAQEESEAQPMMKREPSTKEASLAGEWAKNANSSLPVETLSGPRVDSLDRGDQTGPWGSFNVDEVPSDDWFDHGTTEYEYPHEDDNDLRESSSLWAQGIELAQSSVPDSTTDDTPTEAWDFGIGYGAKGQGAGGYENPSDEDAGTKGVWGPHSGLPGTPSQSVGDTNPIIDVNINERHALLSLLPGDTDEPVARSDYFPGWKGNLVQAEGPLQAESELPQETAPRDNLDGSLINTYYKSEDTETPYVRYDYTTPTYRDDPLHDWPERGKIWLS